MGIITRIIEDTQEYKRAKALMGVSASLQEVADDFQEAFQTVRLDTERSPFEAQFGTNKHANDIKLRLFIDEKTSLIKAKTDTHILTVIPGSEGSMVELVKLGMSVFSPRVKSDRNRVGGK